MPDITIKTQTEIETQMVQAVPTATAKITFFGNSGIAKSIIKAAAAVIRDIYHLLSNIARARFLNTAAGSDLDDRVAEDGITRLGAVAASVVLVPRGTVGTIIPQGTIVICTVNNIQYATTQNVTIGTKNPDLNGITESIGLADAVLAEAQTVGVVGNAPIGTVTQLQTPIVGVDAITNPMMGYGGQDAETDSQLRERTKNRITLLNQGTQVFYEELAKNADTKVLRAIAAPSLTYSVNVTLANRSGASFTGAELLSIGQSIYDNQRAFSPITCLNISYTGITISFSTTLKPGTTLDDVYTLVADNVSNFLDYRSWAFGATVQYDDLIRIVSGTDGIDNLNVGTSFLVNGGRIDVSVASDSLPRFTRLTITDETTSTTKDVLLDQGFV